MALTDIKPLLEQAARAYQHQDYPLAASIASEACKKAPDSIDAWDFHGMACQESGDRDGAAVSYKKALKLAQKAYKKNPKDGKMALRQLFLLIRLDQKTEIEKLLALLQERHPDSPGLKKLVASYRLRQS
jgi:tetratricopeptide (TPR) repeat protein